DLHGCVPGNGVGPGVALLGEGPEGDRDLRLAVRNLDVGKPVALLVPAGDQLPAGAHRRDVRVGAGVHRRVVDAGVPGTVGREDAVVGAGARRRLAAAGIEAPAGSGSPV